MTQGRQIAAGRNAAIVTALTLAGVLPALAQEQSAEGWPRRRRTR